MGKNGEHSILVVPVEEKTYINKKDLEKGFDIYKKMGDSEKKKDEAELSNEEIDNEINSCKENPIDLEVYLEELFPQLNESGRETIVKLAYWVSISDGHFDKEEEIIEEELDQIIQKGKKVKILKNYFILLSILAQIISLMALLFLFRNIIKERL